MMIADDDGSLVFLIFAALALISTAGVLWRLYAAAQAPRPEEHIDWGRAKP